MSHLHESCPVCNAARWRVDDVAGHLLGLTEPFHVQFCRDCGLGRLLPQLSSAELKSLYNGSYFNSHQYSDCATPGWLPPDADYCTQVVPERLTKFAKTLRELCRLAPQASTLLDVGAATGEMIKLARDNGLAADGLEFSEFASRQARERYGIELMNVPLAQLQKPEGYDLIHLNHVFEHFNEPRTELEHLQRLLNPGGLLYIEVPLQFHVVERLRFRLKPTERSLSVESLHHPFFYNANTLRRLLHENGFEVVGTRVFDAFRYPSTTVVQSVKRTMWRLLSAFEIGNFVEIIARPGASAR